MVSFQQGLDTGVRVTRNQPLVQMYDSELELRVVRLQNDINRCEEEINALTTQMELASSETQRVQIAARRKQKEFERDRKQAELLALKRRTDADLSRPGHFWLRAPIDGIILTSAFRERWLNRFVKPTDPLLHIGDPHQGWEIETRIPHYHLGHILESFAGRDELDVDVLLRSAPTRLFKGKLHRKDLAGEAISEPGTEPFVLARIRIAGADIPFDDRIPDDLLLAGTDIRLRIDCGPRSLAYSWFHGFWEFVHEALFF
ncbi:MAG: hypothetical protein KatS3mg105_1831 [Gemmatales bacterium]|nr:MAG: hypothetical protein KatS3mg105_1831 [Gemmatales bacterium]